MTHVAFIILIISKKDDCIVAKVFSKLNFKITFDWNSNLAVRQKSWVLQHWNQHTFFIHYSYYSWWRVTHDATATIELRLLQELPIDLERYTKCTKDVALDGHRNDVDIVWYTCVWYYVYICMYIYIYIYIMTYFDVFKLVDIKFAGYQ